MVICSSTGYSYSVLMWPRFAVCEPDVQSFTVARWKDFLPHSEYKGQMSVKYLITINVPLFKKLRDIIFFCGTITL